MIPQFPYYWLLHHVLHDVVKGVRCAGDSLQGLKGHDARWDRRSSHGRAVVRGIGINSYSVLSQLPNCVSDQETDGLRVVAAQLRRLPKVDLDWRLLCVQADCAEEKIVETRLPLAHLVDHQARRAPSQGVYDVLSHNGEELVDILTLKGCGRYRAPFCVGSVHEELEKRVHH